MQTRAADALAKHSAFNLTSRGSPVGSTVFIDDSQPAILQSDAIPAIIDMVNSNTSWVQNKAANTLTALAKHGAFNLKTKAVSPINLIVFIDDSLATGNPRQINICLFLICTCPQPPNL